MAYKRFEIDLTAVRAVADKKELVSRDKKIREVFITKALGSFQLHFGPDGDAIDIDAPISFAPDGDEAAKGLFWSNNLAQVGVAAQVVYGAFGGRVNANPEQ